ncbi:hypothetical protein ACOSQ2_009320 [Xanthoceras sorbifolium]
MASSSSNNCQQTQSQQSQQSSTMDFGSLAKTLHFNLPIKLDEDNYIYWKTQILPAVNALDLEEYIDSSKHPPSQFISVQVTDESGNVRLELQPNKEYQKWKKSDQILLFWLISTLSQKVVGQVTKCKSSLEAWSKLENLYSQKSMAKILNLRQQLQTIRKGSHSVSDFVLKIKNIGDALSAAGEEVSEKDLLLSLMHGVGHEYDAVVVLISSQRMTMSLEEAQFLLLMHEQRIEQLNSPNNFGGISANFVTNNAGDKRDHRGGSNYNRGGQRGRGRGGRFGGRKLYCQQCTKPGHHAFQCFHRFDQQFVRPQPSHYTNNNSHSAAAPNQAYIGQFSHNSDQQNTVSQGFHQEAFQPQGNYTQTSAYVAAPAGGTNDSSWFVDSGATNHITSDLNNLSLKSEYKGNDRLAVGNGQLLPISNVGSFLCLACTFGSPSPTHSQENNAYTAHSL